MSFPWSTRLGVASATSGTNVTVGTVPTGKRWVVKSMTAYQDGTGSGAAEVRIGAVAGRLWKTGVLAADQWAGTDDRHLVLTAGETIQVRAVTITGTCSISLQAHGFELDDT